MKNILITGWYGVHNTGDEAILSALLYRMKKIGYGKLSVMSYSPNTTASIHQVKSVPELRLDLMEAMMAISQADVLVIGGGGLLKDEGRNYLLLLVKCWLAKLTRTKIIISGIGVGPLYTSFGVWITRQITNLADVIAVRDIESRQLLNKIGITKNIHVTGDLALGIKAPNPDFGKKFLTAAGINMSPDRTRIGLSLRPWYHLPRFWPDGKKLYNEFLEKIINAIQYLSTTYDADFVFIPMQYEQDVAICKILNNRLQNRRFFDALCYRKMNFLETASVLANLDLVIGMRLHSLILASIYGKPIYAISYSDKVSSFVRQIQKDWYLDIDNFDKENFISSISNILRDRENAADQVKYQTVILQEASLTNYEYISNVIEGKHD